MNESPLIEKKDNNTIVVSGKLQINEINELLGTDLDDEDIDTIGGWIFAKKLDATFGTIVEYKDFQFIVEEIEGDQIKKIKIVKN